MKTREKIINAAVELFSEKGYHDTKMADITEKAGVAKGTAY
ncbi:MAG: TetR/AcrR family transcriptional regulator, partial [Bacillota bacterium]